MLVAALLLWQVWILKDRIEYNECTKHDVVGHMIIVALGMFIITN